MYRKTLLISMHSSAAAIQQKEPYLHSWTASKAGGSTWEPILPGGLIIMAGGVKARSSSILIMTRNFLRLTEPGLKIISVAPIILKTGRQGNTRNFPRPMRDC